MPLHTSQVPNFAQSRVSFTNLERDAERGGREGGTEVWHPNGGFWGRQLWWVWWRRLWRSRALRTISDSGGKFSKVGAKVEIIEGKGPAIGIVS